MQPLHDRTRIRLAAGDDQTAGGVVDAVAMFYPRSRQQRVLEQAAVVGESVEMVEDHPDSLDSMGSFAGAGAGAGAGVEAPHDLTSRCR
jgi:hypothetical protein